MRRSFALLAAMAVVCCALPNAALRASVRSAPTPPPTAAVLQVQVIPVTRAYAILHQLFPKDRIRVDSHANALIVFAPEGDVDSMRTVLQGVDIKDPTQPLIQVVPLHVLKPAALIARLHPMFPNAAISRASASSVIVRAAPLEMAQITSLIGTLDQAPNTPVPTSAPVEAITIHQARPRDVARAVAHELPRARVSVSGSNILLTGDPDQVAKAKDLIATLDVPTYGSRFTTVYHVKNVDAGSVGDLIARSFPDVRVTVDKELNALSIQATAPEQQRIGDSITQLGGQGAPGGGGFGGSGSQEQAAYGADNVDVVHIRSAMPGQNSGPSTTAQDIAQAVSQVLQPLAPDLHMTVLASTNRILLAGSPSSIKMAEDLISRLDVIPPQVELDTEVFEVDENSAKDLGLQFPSGGAVLSSTFSEMTPPYDPNTGLPARIGRLQSITRTPLQLQLELNLLVQKGNARVLADPSVTTLSGDTASIRAGDQLSILTQTGGGVGTPVTQQLQTFSTGVTLDITPVVSDEGDILVSLHPVVNSLEGTSSNGVPQISTRDTQTSVDLQNDQTLVIGGLIQDTYSSQTSGIPVLGNLPLLGSLFRGTNTSGQRNELVIMVTPHILKTGESAKPPHGTLPLPNPGALPTLPPNTQLPSSHETPSPYRGEILATPVPAQPIIPAPTPSAFGDANVFQFGNPPPNTYAAPEDAPQIFYARFSPTVVQNGTPVTLSVITTTNVTRVTIGTSSSVVNLTRVGQSQWQATYTFTSAGLPSTQGTQNLTLSAFSSSRSIAATIQIPVSLLAQSGISSRNRP